MSFGHALRHSILLVATILLLPAADAGAQPDLCSPLLCSLVQDCDDGDTAVCRPGGCDCRRACNAERDCTGSETCWRGQCIGALPESCNSNEHCPSGQRCSGGACVEPCNARRDCPSGLVCTAGECRACTSDGACGSGQRCAQGLCEAIPSPTPTAAPTPECRTSRDCNDLNPCNGEEVCDGFACQRGPTPCPPVQLPSTNFCVRDPAGSQCARCDLKLVATQEPFEGELVIPEGFLPRRPRPVPPRPRFSARVTIDARALGGRDVTSARVGFVLSDPKGVGLVGYNAEPGAWDATQGFGWTKGTKGELTFRDTRDKSRVQTIVVRPVGEDRYSIEVEGAERGAHQWLDASSRPGFLIEVAWKDVAPLFIPARRLVCAPSGTGLRCATAARK